METLSAGMIPLFVLFQFYTENNCYYLTIISYIDRNWSEIRGFWMQIRNRQLIAVANQNDKLSIIGAVNHCSLGLYLILL